jgi:hypothetical protein
MAVFWVAAPCSLVHRATTQRTDISILDALRTRNVSFSSVAVQRLRTTVDAI